MLERDLDPIDLCPASHRSTDLLGIPGRDMARPGYSRIPREGRHRESGTFLDRHDLPRPDDLGSVRSVADPESVSGTEQAEMYRCTEQTVNYGYFYMHTHMKNNPKTRYMSVHGTDSGRESDPMTHKSRNTAPHLLFAGCVRCAGGGMGCFRHGSFSCPKLQGGVFSIGTKSPIRLSCPTKGLLLGVERRATAGDSSWRGCLAVPRQKGCRRVFFN